MSRFSIEVECDFDGELRTPDRKCFPSLKSAIGNPQSAIGNRQSAIRNPQSAIRNPSRSSNTPSCTPYDVPYQPPVNRLTRGSRSQGAACEPDEFFSLKNDK